MPLKNYAFIGILAPVIFLLTYLIMSAMRPDYSHLTSTITELGSKDAPNKWIWNGVGYALVGIMISVFSMGLHKGVNPHGKGKVPFIGLLLSGLFMVLSGVFPADLSDARSFHMTMHGLGALGTYICFLIAAFGYPGQLNKSDYWSKTVLMSLLFASLTIVSGFFSEGETPGLGERLGILFYFLWVGYMSVKLWGYDPKT